MYASLTWCTHAKKTHNRSDRTCLAFDFTQQSRHRAGGHPCAHRLFIRKESSHKFAVFFFCKRNAFFRVDVAHHCFEKKSMRISSFKFVSATARFPTCSSATPNQVPRLVPCQTSGCRTLGRTLTANKQLTDYGLRLLDHELAYFVLWISRPLSSVRKWQLSFFKGLFLGEKLTFSNESPTNENEMFVNASIGLTCYANLASSEATINEVRRGCMKLDRSLHYCLGTSNGAWPESLRAAGSLLFLTCLMDKSRSNSEKMDKKEKSDDYDSPSDLWSVF